MRYADDPSIECHHNATDQYDAAVCRWQQLIAATNGFINILHWPREATRGEASKHCGGEENGSGLIARGLHVFAR